LLQSRCQNVLEVCCSSGFDATLFVAAAAVAAAVLRVLLDLPVSADVCGVVGSSNTAEPASVLLA
jgi:hypothetical protein